MALRKRSLIRSEMVVEHDRDETLDVSVLDGGSALSEQLALHMRSAPLVRIQRLRGVR
jgi:hypothetical protein